MIIMQILVSVIRYTISSLSLLAVFSCELYIFCKIKSHFMIGVTILDTFSSKTNVYCFDFIILSEYAR